MCYSENSNHHVIISFQYNYGLTYHDEDAADPSLHRDLDLELMPLAELASNYFQPQPPPTTLTNTTAVQSTAI
jgi:hypothetical protein